MRQESSPREHSNTAPPAKPTIPQWPRCNPRQGRVIIIPFYRLGSSGCLPKAQALLLLLADGLRSSQPSIPVPNPSTLGSPLSSPHSCSATPLPSLPQALASPSLNPSDSSQPGHGQCQINFTFPPDSQTIEAGDTKSLSAYGAPSPDLFVNTTNHSHMGGALIPKGEIR